MDGVMGMTQSAVTPGTEFLYDFAPKDAGTYWYHPHNRTYEHMARGLYGALIVDEWSDAPEVDRDEALLLDDWRLNDKAQIADGFGNMHDWSHAGRIGNWITVNGASGWSREVPRLTRMRLRIVNSSNARILTLEARGLEGWVVALDGMPLETPQSLDQFALAPAQRADLIVDVIADEGEEAIIVSRERAGGYAIASCTVLEAGREARLTKPDALPLNPIPALGSLKTATRAELRMEGGAMGGMRKATMGGQVTGIRDLAAAGKIWDFNGTVDKSDSPLVEASLGETVRIAMTNDTAWTHGMHLNVHHFRLIGREGALGPLRDTILMNRGETVEIAFVADNPGDWLLHCQMLEHSASGMMTWLRVT